MSWISEFQRQYNLVVYRYEPVAQGFWLETNRGTAILHSLPDAFLPKEEFVGEVYKAVYQRGQVLPIFPNAENRLITRVGNDSYFLMNWPYLESEWVDYRVLGESLARFHCMTGECLEKFSSKFRGWGSWPKMWKAKVEQMRKFQSIASSRIDTDGYDPFDSFFLENFSYLSYLGSASLAYLHDSNYRYVCEETYCFGRLSYIHFSHEQFVITPQGQVFFADPFSWIEDARVRDIGQFIKADVRECGWNPQHILSFLSGYHYVSPLLPEEFTVMYAMFLLPGRFMKKLETMYVSPSILSPGPNVEVELFREETDGLTSKSAYTELRRNEILIREFPRFVEDTFSVAIPRII